MFVKSPKEYLNELNRLNNPNVNQDAKSNPKFQPTEWDPEMEEAYYEDQHQKKIMSLLLFAKLYSAKNKGLQLIGVVQITN